MRATDEIPQVFGSTGRSGSGFHGCFTLASVVDSRPGRRVWDAIPHGWLSILMSSISVDVLARSSSADSALPQVHARTRVASIDALRGFVIVLMALDHVRDYFTGAHFDPMDLTQTDVAYFATRWITHLCAPTFIFLAGISAHLMSLRMTQSELRLFLITRGIWADRARVHDRSIRLDVQPAV